MEELKLCPFCGGLAHIMQEKRTVSIEKQEVLEYAHVECCDCGTRGCTIQYKRQRGKGWKTGELEEEAGRKAAEKWNRRVKIKEKAKPVWKPQKNGIGVKKIEFAFCPRCGIMLHEMCVKGERMHEKYCKNCGVKINWEEDEGAGEPR